MWQGVCLYFAGRLKRKAVFIFRFGGLVLALLGSALSGRIFRIRYYAHNDYLYRLSVRHDDFGFDLTVLAIGLVRWFGCRAAIAIRVNRFNYFYIPEMIGHCLSLKGIEFVDKHRFYDKDKRFWAAYLRFIDNLNEYLASFHVQIEIEKGEDVLINRVLNAIDRKITERPESWTTFNRKVMVLEDAKRFSPARAGRFVGLFAEEAVVGPEVVVMDIYHRCNTDCVHCWMHSPKARKLLTEEFLSQKMDLPMMKSVVDDCAALAVDAITLLGDGEPVLHPDFLKILWHIKKANSHINVMTFSNGLVVTPRMSRELVSAGLNEIWFSVPAASEATYRKVCPSKKGEDFLRIRRNIAYLCRLKRTLKKSYDVFSSLLGKKHAQYPERKGRFQPYCILAFVLHSENYHEILEMAKMAVELGVDEMRFQLIHLDKDNRSLQLNQAQVDFLNEKMSEVKTIAAQGEVVLSSALHFQLSHMSVPSGDWSRGYYLQHGCPIGFFFSIIKANGDVGLCCGLKVVDNLKERSFYDIWMSSRYGQARAGAKHLAENKDMAFQKTDYHKDEPRGDLLYSERCEYCDNHDLNNQYISEMMEHGLFERFMKNAAHSSPKDPTCPRT
jgi:MoaA/NifB/PqqE/SkfB family radical SAM enzyme